MAISFWWQATASRLSVSAMLGGIALALSICSAPTSAGVSERLCWRVAEARFDVVAINDKGIAFYRGHGVYPVGRSVKRDAREDMDDLVFAISTDRSARLPR